MGLKHSQIISNALIKPLTVASIIIDNVVFKSA